MTTPAEIAVRRHSDPHLTYYQLHTPLGALVMEFAELESEVTNAINLLLRLSYPEGAALESVMQNFAMRIELFHAVATMHTKHPDLLREVKRISTGLHEANSNRNNFIHNEWTTAALTGKTFGKVRHKAGGGRLRKVPNLEDVSIVTIWNAIDHVFSVCQRLKRWQECFRIRNPARWPHPLPDHPLRSPRRSAEEAQRRSNDHG